MDPTMTNPICHFEIGCRDREKTQQFFGQLFEWKITDAGPASFIETGDSVGGRTRPRTAQLHHLLCQGKRCEGLPRQGPDSGRKDACASDHASNGNLCLVRRPRREYDRAVERQGVGNRTLLRPEFRGSASQNLPLHRRFQRQRSKLVYVALDVHHAGARPVGPK